MAQKVSNFKVADPLDGTEIVPVIQGGGNRRTTVQKIADKATAANIIDDAVPAFDKVFSSQKTTDLVANKVDKVTGKGLSTEDYTTAEKTKLAGLESSHFKGLFTTLTYLQTAFPTAVAGDYADVDAGTGSDTIRYVWDVSDTKWVASGSGSPLTAAQVKTLYESNPDTNAFTDAFKTKLTGIQTGAQVNYAFGTTAGTAAEGNDTRINNGQTAFSWGNHALAGYLTSSSSLDWAKVTGAPAFITGVTPTTGGTGQTSWAKGDILYASAIDTLSRLAVGTDGYVLTLQSGLPVWAAASGGGGTVDITADYAWTGIHTFTKTLVATANNQTLANLNINTSTSDGSFTGVNFYSINANGTIRAAGANNSVAFYVGNGSAIRGDAASNGTLYIDASRALTGTINIRATSLTLPAFSNSSVTTTSLTVSGSNTVLSLTGGGATTSLRIGNQTNGATWYIENSRNATAGSLVISNSIGTPKAIVISPNQTIVFGGINPDASAQIEILSTTKGFLPPRMTTTNKTSIATPAEALFLYDNVLKKMCFYNGSAWETITSA